ADVLGISYGSTGHPATVQVTDQGITASDDSNNDISNLTYVHIETVETDLADPGAGFRNAVYIDSLSSDFNLVTNGNTDVTIGNAFQNAAALLNSFSITLNNNGTAADNLTLDDQASLVDTMWNITTSSVNAAGNHSVSMSGTYANITVNGGVGGANG